MTKTSLTEKAQEMAKAETSHLLLGGHLAEKLLYEWVKTDAITLPEFVQLINALGYVWDRGCLPDKFTEDS